jgi:hypothetical protein
MQQEEVGYKKPPRKYQFKPGKSGNPKGRPPEIPNIQTELVEALSKMTTNGGIKVSNLRAIIDSQIKKAKAGDTSAAKFVLAYYDSCGIKTEADREVDYKGARELFAARVAGIAHRLGLVEVKPEDKNENEDKKGEEV